MLNVTLCFSGKCAIDDADPANHPGADEVCDDAIAWLRRHAHKRFFAWVHLFDPHYPYVPPPQHRSPDVHPYDGEITFVDEQIGRLTEALHELDLAADTLVVLTADHGEGLWDHGEELHGVFIYRVNEAGKVTSLRTYWEFDRLEMLPPLAERMTD